MERKRSSRRYRYRQKSWTEKCKDYFRQFVAFMFSNVGIIGLVVGYTIGGAFIFIAIEGGVARKGHEEVSRLRNETVARLWDLTTDLNVFNESHWRASVADELLSYQHGVIEAAMNGFDGSDGSGGGKHWSFPGAFLYSLTVITTIGYGNVAPRTAWGKLATILYAMAGMPLFLLYLSNLGDVLAKTFKWAYGRCCLCRGCGRRRPPALPPSVMVEEPGDDAVSEESSEDYDPQTVTVPVTLCLAIMVGYVCFGAALFSEWEHWNFLDGSYFCFISLSTIGFGDLVPGDQVYATQGIELSFIFCSMYLMLGMALIAMAFNLMQEEVVHKLRGCVRTLRIVVRCRRGAGG